jgi:hypothetical protein
MDSDIVGTFARAHQSDVENNVVRMSGSFHRDATARHRRAPARGVTRRFDAVKTGALLCRRLSTALRTLSRRSAIHPYRRRS